ncbi:hypothetical protein BG004_007183 [Podila humilis]|nr:hypothetical protein BG004_007183 [Podila humilis]
MVDSDSASSDLSEASSLSCDNSSGSEADGTGPRLQKTKVVSQHTSSGSSSSGSESDTEGSVSDSTDPDDNGDSAHGKRPPSYMRAGKKHASIDARADFLAPSAPKEKKKRERTSRPPPPDSAGSAPISLSDSKPVYSQHIVDKSMLLLPSSSKFNLPPGATFPGRGGSAGAGRGRGRGRAKVPLAAGRAKYGASGAIEIDFNETSPPPEDITPDLSFHPLPTAPLSDPTGYSRPLDQTLSVRSTPLKKEPPAERSKPGPKPGKGAMSGATNTKAGSKKVGRPPKSVSKEVYCICRGPYDGVEFMIACDRCEEWFHGRCIGMKPQDAKKSNHYYCETCQKIRRMLGVGSPVDEPVKPAGKPKSSGLKAGDKFKALDADHHPSTSATKAKPKKTKTKAGQEAHAPISIDDTPTPNHTHHPQQYQAPHSVFYSPTSTVTWQAQATTLPLPKSTKAHPAKVPKRKSAAVPTSQAVTDTASVYEPAPKSTPQAQARPVVVPQPVKAHPNVAVDEEDDEDVCPVCDFECTCNAEETVSTVVSKVTTSCLPEQSAHVFVSDKVPFQPDVSWENTDHSTQATLSTGMTQQMEMALSIASDNSMDSDQGFIRSAYANLEEDEDDDDESVQDNDVEPMHENETFHTSYKNPMSTPTSSRRPSISPMPKRSGKGIGKAPHFSSSTDVMRSRGKSLKGGKAAMYMYKHAMTSSESEASNGSDNGEPLDSRYADHSAQRRARYESDSGNEHTADAALVLSSGSSLSEEDEFAARGRRPSVSFAPNVSYLGSGAKLSKSNHNAKIRFKIKNGPQYNRHVEQSHHKGAESVVVEDGEDHDLMRILNVVKKRGPGRPKKLKDSLLVSREDEMALYTPAVTSRKLTTIQHKRATVRASHSPSKNMHLSEVLAIKYDNEVAEDVAAVNAEDSDQEAGTALGAEVSFSEGDIFGDSDLSDELSGELSDIPSENLDDLSEDAIEFIDSDDDQDETSSSSSGSSPREFHYSDMEEEDESLVDSDSSINSISTDESDTSDSVSDSEMEPVHQNYSDDEEGSIVFEQDGMDELIDEEELISLAEEERRFLAKAHSLHDDWSEEESDRSRNPFESSEDEGEDDEDECVFDADGEEYSEDCYEDDYYEDDYYEDDFEGMDEAEILAQLKGVQVDMQALMMIPPEQQEQLLLLQHYAEIHQQQQQLQLQAVDSQYEHAAQPETAPDSNLTQQGSLPDLLAVSSLMSFDMNVPDLDAVSQQLADSIAKSMSAAGEGLTGQDNLGLLTAAAESVGDRSAGSPVLDIGHSSPISTSSISPTSAAVNWAAHTSSSPNSVNSIPTPANTPTPPGTIIGASPSISRTSVSGDLAKTADVPNAATGITSPTGASGRRGSRVHSSDKSHYPLSNSPAYKPLSSVVTSPSLGKKSSTSGGKLAVDISPGTNGTSTNSTNTGGSNNGSTMTTQLSILSQASNLFKEAAQRALSSVATNVHKPTLEESKGDTIADRVGSGGTTEEPSPVLVGVEFKKHKGDSLICNEDPHLDKRLKMSTTPTNPYLASVQDMDMNSASVSPAPSGDSFQSSSIYPNSSSTSTPSVSTSGLSASPTSGGISPTIASTSASTPTAATTAATSVDATATRSVLASAASTGIESNGRTLDLDTPEQFDVSKVTMPFVDPTAQMIQSFKQPALPLTFQHHQHVRHRRRSSLKGKEIKQVDNVTALPMDDLLDTSALYGRSSSRSPSPERGAKAAGEDSEMSTQTLKDLNRWERVPIGTFRRSRRPSSPYIGLQSALKSNNNVAMPATLLADHHHHQHQQLLQQRETGSDAKKTNIMIHGLHGHRRRGSGMMHQHTHPPVGIRKHRPTASASSLLGFRPDGRPDLTVQGLLAHRKEIVALVNSLGRQEQFKTSAQTPPSVHAGMMMEDLGGFSALNGGRGASGGGGGGSSSGSHGNPGFVQRSHSFIEGSIGHNTRHERSQSIRRKRRGEHGSLSLGHPRPGSRAGSPHSVESFGQLNMVIPSGRGIGVEKMSSGGGGGRAASAGATGSAVLSSLSFRGMGSCPGTHRRSEGSVQRGGGDGGGGGGSVEDLMTDSSQLPSSACPTPLHSPLFSATDPGHHHGTSSGQDVKSGVPRHDVLVPHFELDIGKEMDDYASGQQQQQQKKADGEDEEEDVEV